MNSNSSQFAYVTLLTCATYLPGVIILADSLQRSGAKHSLVVLVTPSFRTHQCANALQEEARWNPLIIIRNIKDLTPPSANTGSVAKRFRNTFTKLRAFELYNEYEKCVFLDADMAALKNPDELFEIDLPSDQWIAASHACICNLDQDEWAPPHWHKSNCAHSPLRSPHDFPLQPSRNLTKPAYDYLNSGMFVFMPHESLWLRILDCFMNSSKITEYKFPDQDFLADFFQGRWKALPWKYNALKTMDYIHPTLWSDHDVVILHYIVDKPWAQRVASDDVAGYLGRDSRTHRTWWKMYEDWKNRRMVAGNPSTPILLRCINELVAPELTSENDSKQVKENLRFEDHNGNLIATKPLPPPSLQSSVISIQIQRQNNERSDGFLHDTFEPSDALCDD
ncbi:MAG: hypothetical protein Q9227_002925 [Pyrenula ochraceoflavens]